MFYANWCGYCHAIKDVYVRFKKSHPSLPIYVYHAGDEDSLNDFTGVNGFPTIAHIGNGRLHKSFDQERTVERLGAWAKHVLPKSLVHETPSQNTFFTAPVIETNELNSFPVHVMFFSPTCPPCQRTKEPYTDAAGLYNKPVYAVNILTNQSLKDRYEITGVPTIAWVMGPGPGDMVRYMGEREAGKISEWMKSH